MCLRFNRHAPPRIWPVLAFLALAVLLLAESSASASQRERARPQRAPADSESTPGTGSESAVPPGELLQRLELLEREVFDLQAQRDAEGKRFSFSIYGVMNYIQRDWETDRDAHNSIDLERFVVGLSVPFSDRVRLDSEVEFEHGGTGATMELDKQEESGEFEQEVEKGGEVVVEELVVSFEQSEQLVWHVGHFVVPVGLINVRHRPGDYFTGYRSEAETSMIPVTWHESGFALSGRWGALEYETGVVNGLDSTGFSSGGWVSGGHQTRFEEANADDPAVFLRLDWTVVPGLILGTAAYQGNTTGNRPKPDLGVDAVVTIAEVDGFFRGGPVTVRAEIMQGTLGNAEAVTKANKGLSNNLHVERTPVASEATAFFVEAGYDLFSLGASSSGGERDTRLDLFVRYDDYDTMAGTTGSVVDNDFWQRRVSTIGLNWVPLRGLIVKAHTAVRTLGSGQQDNTTLLGLGIDY